MELTNFEQDMRPDNILLYGPPGAGKTHVSSTVGEVYYTLHFDTEKGNLTIKKLPKAIRDNVVSIRYTQFTDLNDIYQMLAHHNTPEEWEKFFASKNIKFKPKKPFEAFILDTLSELQRKMALELQQTDMNTKLKNPRNIKPLRIQDWGAVGDLSAVTVADAFGALPIIFICTAHEQIIKDEITGAVYGTPKIYGKLAFDLGKYFDVVGHMTTTQSGEYAVALKPHGKWQAKSRFIDDAAIVNPTYKKLVGLE